MVVVMMAAAVVMMVAIAAMGVGAALGIEGRFDRGDLGAKARPAFPPARPADQDAAFLDRGGHMAVSEMPGERVR